MFRNLTLILLLVAGIATFSYAQAPIQASIDKHYTVNSDNSLDESVFMDVDSKTCYVDLERLPVNYRQAALINGDGDEVIVKPLNDVPVNSIVELDYSELPSGDYLLELRSYTGASHMSLRL